MNLTEEKKAPLRHMNVAQKKIMLEKFVQSKGPSRVGFLNAFNCYEDAITCCLFRHLFNQVFL